jgi:hypothetical protein
LQAATQRLAGSFQAMQAAALSMAGAFGVALGGAGLVQLGRSMVDAALKMAF